MGGFEMEGSGIDEVGRWSTGEVVVRIDPRYFRPAEVDTLLGDPSGPPETGMDAYHYSEELVAEMVQLDREEVARKTFRLKGFKVVGSMENPPTTSSATQVSRGKG